MRRPGGAVGAGLALSLTLSLTLALTVSACGLPRPFQHDAWAPAQNPLTAPVGGLSVSLPPLVGAPPAIAMASAEALAAELRARDVAAVAVEGSSADTAGLMLMGWVLSSEPIGAEAPMSGGQALDLRWTLMDQSGRLIGEDRQTVTLPALVWSERPAQAGRMLALAARPRLVALLAPGDAAGAVAVAAAPVTSTRPESVATMARPPSPDRAPARSVTEDPARAADAAALPASTGGARHPAAVDDVRDLMMAPPEITRAPGDGRTALAEALTRLFRQNGVRIVEQARPDRLLVRGAVQVTPGATSDQEQVSIVWEVLDAEGESLGTVRQANAVPRGLLDRPWGETASLIAEGAAAGVGEILIRKGLVPAP
jgi:hypothetical protein